MEQQTLNIILTATITLNGIGIIALSIAVRRLQRNKADWRGVWTDQDLTRNRIHAIEDKIARLEGKKADREQARLLAEYIVGWGRG